MKKYKAQYNNKRKVFGKSNSEFHQIMNDIYSIIDECDDPCRANQKVAEYLQKNRT